MSQSNNREYDIVLFGATGFAGQLCADKLYNQTNVNNLKWAIVGRNKDKLNKIKQSLHNSNNSNNEYPHVLTVDINNQTEVDNIVKQSYVVLTTVGPYALHGEPVVRACAEYGTDYADITGETTWVADMIDKYETKAKQSGAKLISLAGYDSLPADLGSLYAVNELQHKLNEINSNAHIVSDRGYVSFKTSGSSMAASGGTLLSIINLIEQYDMEKITDKEILTPTQYKLNNDQVSDQLLPSYSNDIKQWTTTFLMASANTRVVRRSVALYKQAGYNYSNSNTFNKFTYHESMVVSNVFAATAISSGLGLGGALLLIPPIRKLLKSRIQSGSGPSKQDRDNTISTYTHVATSSNNDKLYTEVYTVDPGYGNTATFLTQTGLLLLDDAKNNKKQQNNNNNNTLIKSGNKINGIDISGYHTVATALGYRLIDRLNSLNCGIEIKVTKFVKGQQ